MKKGLINAFPFFFCSYLYIVIIILFLLPFFKFLFFLFADAHLISLSTTILNFLITSIQRGDKTKPPRRIVFRGSESSND